MAPTNDNDLFPLLDEILHDQLITTLFQPIVALDSGEIVAHEALSRGPAGPLRSPLELFAAAGRAGRLAELDELCRRSAITRALEAGLVAPATVFVNVEPQVLESGRPDDLMALVQQADGKLQVVLEITERAIAARPADLLSTVTRLREAGWRIALDDVGADDMSLAFMPLLRPDIVKLDLRLVQRRPGPAVAGIMNAVNAYAERSGALLLAEGIEDERHLAIARALGARLGQGWMFGRPAATTVSPLPAGRLPLPPVARPAPAASPFGCLPPELPLRRSTKPLLIEVSKHLEREAMRLGSTCVVVATFQEARHFTTATSVRYRELAQRVGFVAAVGAGLGPEPALGVRGSDLEPTDPVRGEWDLIVLAPHFAAALLARDLGDTGEDAGRRFEFALTYDRDTVTAAAASLMSRVLPSRERPERAVPAPAGPAASAAGAAPALDAETSLRRALAATTNGVTIADMRHPDHPLVYVNAAFERLSGIPAEQIIGRNCRVLQGAATDRAAVDRIRQALRDGREVRETILNYRGPALEPWWNEIYLAPVFDDTGRLTQYIGIQSDVTSRIEAEQRLAAEQRRSAEYLAEVEALAYHDPLTGLLNRRSVHERLPRAMARADSDGTALGVLYLDVDGFKKINDQHGHAAGDAVLVAIAERLRSCLQRDDLVARIGGDEFLVVLGALRPATAAEDAQAVATRCVETLGLPIDGFDASGTLMTVSVSIGAVTYPADGTTFDALVHAADQRMYAAKQARYQLSRA